MSSDYLTYSVCTQQLLNAFLQICCRLYVRLCENLVESDLQSSSPSCQCLVTGIAYMYEVSYVFW